MGWPATLYQVDGRLGEDRTVIEHFRVKLQLKPVRCFLIVRGKGRKAKAVRFITRQSRFGYRADASMVAYWLNRGK